MSTFMDEPIRSMPAGTTSTEADLERDKQQRQRLADAIKQQEEEEKRRLAADQQNKQTPNSPIQEVGTAIVGGVGDFIQDVDAKMVPFLDIPDNWSPVNQTGWGKALRSFTSVFLPTLAATMLTKRGANKLIGKDALAKIPGWGKYLGEVGAGAAVGVGVDAISRESEGENLARVLKDNLPGQFGWLPDDITTLDTDSPDIKRQKNIIEGAGIGALTDLLDVGVQLFRGARGLSNGLEIKPKDEAAKAYDAKVKENTPTDPIEDLTAREAAREDVRFRRGVRDIEEDPEGLLPSPDVNTPLYDANEQAVIARPRDAVRQNDIDAARLAGNIDTFDGRMAPLMDSDDYRAANTMDPTGLEARKRLVEERKAAGVYDAKTSLGREITYKMIREGDDTDLRTIFSNLNDDSFASVKKYIEDSKVQWQAGVDFKVLDNVGTTRTARMGRILIDLMDPDNLRASGRLQRTTAGQISDNAAAIKQLYDSGVDATRQEQLQLEMLEFIDREMRHSSYAKGRGLQLMQQTKEVFNDASVRKQIQTEVDATLAKNAEDAKLFVQRMSQLREENPLAFRAVMDTYQATDGRVSTIEDLNRYMDKALSVKGLVARNPDTPNLIVKGVTSTYYNSLLSSTATPLRALVGNTVNTALSIASQFTGAGLRAIGGGGTYQLRRAAAQYGALWDSLNHAVEHFSYVWKNAVQDPNSVKYAAREELVEQDELVFRAAESFAKAAAAEGNYAPLAKYEVARRLRDFNNHPFVRASTNFMTASDGGVRAFMAHVEARGRAFDEIFAKNPKARLDKSDLEVASEKIRKTMFDSDGYIKDEAVEQMSRELTLNLDTPQSRWINQMLEAVPILRTFITFPRTAINSLNFAAKHSHLTGWMTDVRDILKADKMKDMTLAAEIMQRKGRQFDINQWNTLVDETRGRLAMGDILVGGIATAALAGVITGNGPRTDKERRDWMKLGWQPRSFKLSDGSYLSYDAFEPFSTFMALSADLVQIGADGTSALHEELFDKLSYVISMSVVDKSLFAGFRPLMEVIGGQNDYAFKKWVAMTTNATLPFSGLRNQMSQIMFPGLREVDQEVGALIRNRNSFMDAIDPMGKLPYSHDYFDGSTVREFSLPQRIWNYATPFRYNESSEPHRMWLKDIGYDALPTLRKDKWGNDFSPEAASMIAKIMGEEKYLDKQIRKLYKQPWVQEDMNFHRRLRLEGRTSDDIELRNSRTFRELNGIFTRAVRSAEMKLYSMPEFADLSTQGIGKARIKQSQRSGDYATTQELLQMYK